MAQSRGRAGTVNGRSYLPRPGGMTMMTSTPARPLLVPGVSNTLPAPLQTPSVHALGAAQLVVQPDDTTFFGAAAFSNGEEDTLLLDQVIQDGDLDATQLQLQGGRGDETMQLHRQATHEQQLLFPSVGLGERVFELLMQEGSSNTQQGPKNTRRDSQSNQSDVLHRLELGKSKLGRSASKPELSRSRLRNSIAETRSNETVLIDLRGESFVQFDTDVNFGDSFEDSLERQRSIRKSISKVPNPTEDQQDSQVEQALPEQEPQAKAANLSDEIKSFRKQSLRRTSSSTSFTSEDVHKHSQSAASPPRISRPAIEEAPVPVLRRSPRKKSSSQGTLPVVPSLPAREETTMEVPQIQNVDEVPSPRRSARRQSSSNIHVVATSMPPSGELRFEANSKTPTKPTSLLREQTSQPALTQSQARRTVASAAASIARARAPSLASSVPASLAPLSMSTAQAPKGRRRSLRDAAPSRRMSVYRQTGVPGGEQVPAPVRRSPSVGSKKPANSPAASKVVKRRKSSLHTDTDSQPAAPLFRDITAASQSYQSEAASVPLPPSSQSGSYPSSHMPDHATSSSSSSSESDIEMERQDRPEEESMPTQKASKLADSTANATPRTAGRTPKVLRRRRGTLMMGEAPLFTMHAEPEVESGPNISTYSSRRGKGRRLDLSEPAVADNAHQELHHAESDMGDVQVQDVERSWRQKAEEAATGAADISSDSASEKERGFPPHDVETDEDNVQPRHEESHNDDFETAEHVPVSSSQQRASTGLRSSLLSRRSLHQLVSLSPVTEERSRSLLLQNQSSTSFSEAGGRRLSRGDAENSIRVQALGVQEQANGSIGAIQVSHSLAVAATQDQRASSVQRRRSDMGDGIAHKPSTEAAAHVGGAEETAMPGQGDAAIRQDDPEQAWQRQLQDMEAALQDVFGTVASASAPSGSSRCSTSAGTTVSSTSTLADTADGAVSSRRHSMSRRSSSLARSAADKARPVTAAPRQTIARRPSQAASQPTTVSRPTASERRAIRKGRQAAPSRPQVENEERDRGQESHGSHTPAEGSVHSSSALTAITQAVTKVAIPSPPQAPDGSVHAAALPGERVEDQPPPLAAYPEAESAESVSRPEERERASLGRSAEPRESIYSEPPNYNAQVNRIAGQEVAPQMPTLHIRPAIPTADTDLDSASSSDEDLQAPELLSFSRHSATQASAEPTTAIAPTPAPPPQAKPNSNIRAHTRHSANAGGRAKGRPASGTAAPKPYERPSSRLSNREGGATHEDRTSRLGVRPATTRPQRPESRLSERPPSRASERPLSRTSGRDDGLKRYHDPRSSHRSGVTTKPPPLQEQRRVASASTSHPPETTRGRDRTVSVPVNFGGAPARSGSQLRRETSLDDMFSRKQRDRSRSGGIDLTRPAFAVVGSNTSVDKGKNAQMPKKAITVPVGFNFAAPRVRTEKRKRVDVDPVSARPPIRPVSVNAAAPSRGRATTSMAKRCQTENEAQEDEIVGALTVEALQMQEELYQQAGPSLIDKGSERSRDSDRTARSEILNSYLKEMRLAETAQERVEEHSDVEEEFSHTERQQTGSQVALSEHLHDGRNTMDEELTDQPAPKRAKVYTYNVAPPAPAQTILKPVQQRSSQSSRPRRDPPTRAARHDPSAAFAVHSDAPRSRKEAMPKPATARTGPTIAQPFTFRTASREQTSFQERLKAWQDREDESVKAGKTGVRPVLGAVTNHQQRATKPIQFKPFNWATDKRVADRHDFEDRLREKERIQAELAEIKRLEDEAREADEIRKMRAQQIPIAHPVPQFIKDRRRAMAGHP